MAMTRTLFTINGLATELGRDRRTIAAALASVAPDGKDGRWDAWHLSTALQALKAQLRPAGGSYATIILDRLDGWRDRGPIARTAMACSAQEFARASKVDLASVLTWLRSGMPYLEEGDWETGEGFVLCFPWAADWIAMLTNVLRNQGDTAAAKRLNL